MYSAHTSTLIHFQGIKKIRKRDTNTRLHTVHSIDIIFTTCGTRANKGEGLASKRNFTSFTHV